MIIMFFKSCMSKITKHKIVYALLFCSCNLFSQKIKINYSNLKQTNINYDSEDLFISKFNNTIYYSKISASLNGKTIIYKEEAPFNDQTESIEINLSEHIKDQEYWDGFSINKNYIVFLSRYHIFIYKRNNSTGTFEFLTIIDNYPNYTNIQSLSDSTFLFYKCYNFHPSDTKEKVELATFNAEKLNFIDIINPKHDGIIYSCFVNSWIDVSEKNIFFSNTLQYKIYLYNHNLKLVDSIVYLPDNWKHFKDYKIDFETDFSKVNAKECIKEASNRGKDIDRIEKILLLNDSTLLVSVKPPAKKGSHRDVYVWTKKEGKWTLLIDKQKFSSSSLFITKKRFLFGLNYSTPLVVSNNYIFHSELYISPPGFISLKPLFFKRAEKKIDKGQQINNGIYEYRILLKK